MNANAEARNLRLLSHNDLNGQGNGGEGMSLQMSCSALRERIKRHGVGRASYLQA